MSMVEAGQHAALVNEGQDLIVTGDVVMCTVKDSIPLMDLSGGLPILLSLADLQVLSLSYHTSGW